MFVILDPDLRNRITKSYHLQKAGSFYIPTGMADRGQITCQRKMR
jgi:hypothetical protein